MFSVILSAHTHVRTQSGTRFVPSVCIFFYIDIMCVAGVYETKWFIVYYFIHGIAHIQMHSTRYFFLLLLEIGIVFVCCIVPGHHDAEDDDDDIFLLDLITWFPKSFHCLFVFFASSMYSFTLLAPFCFSVYSTRNVDLALCAYVCVCREVYTLFFLICISF